jgi:PKHD-type hydroxylase
MPEPYTNKGETHNSKIRKLSFSCQLSDPNDYEGGELEFAIPEIINSKIKINTFSVKEFLPKGSIIVFPSYIWHRVKSVTKGVRYSLVSWVLGYPFK